MNKEERKYFGNTRTYDYVLEMISCCDYQFYYKGRAYNITFEGSPCIAVIFEGTEIWKSTAKFYRTYKDLLDKHVFDDGVSLLDAFAGDDIGPC